MNFSLRTILLTTIILSMPSCFEEEKPVLLGSSVIDKDLSMTSSKVDALKVDVYLISEKEVTGELLAKAMNAQGLEIGRSKQMLTLQKDDAKLISFTFDSNLEVDLVTKYMLDFRQQ